MPEHSRYRRPIVVGALPPPVHGASIINEAVLSTLSGRGELVRSINLSPGTLTRGLHGRSIRAFAALSGLLRLLIYCLRREAGSLYIGLSGGTGLAIDLCFMAAARAFRLPIYVHHHSFKYLNQRSALARIAFSVAGPRSTHIALCTNMGSLLKESYGVSKVCIISNAAFVDNHAEYDGRNLPRSPMALGFLGNISREKGIFEFLATLGLLRSADLQVAALVAGPFLTNNVRTQVLAETRDMPDVVLAGPVFGSAKDEFFRKIDVLLFPSSYEHEAEPLTILEAMSRGVPVIAWDRGCISHLVDGDAGVSIPRDASFSKMAAERILDWSKRPQYYRCTSQAALQRFDDRRNAALQAVNVIVGAMLKEGDTALTTS